MDHGNQPKILIIGGGMAGISAAKHLIQCGLKDVTILEAKERLGGRIHTIDHGEANQLVRELWPGNVVFVTGIVT